MRPLRGLVGSVRDLMVKYVEGDYEGRPVVGV